VSAWHLRRVGVGVGWWWSRIPGAGPAIRTRKHARELTDQGHGYHAFSRAPPTLMLTTVMVRAG
jgi:hypothetical protein